MNGVGLFGCSNLYFSATSPTVFPMQGVLELEERERSKGEGGQGEDIWLQELQDQIRNGILSEDN